MYLIQSIKILPRRLSLSSINRVRNKTITLNNLVTTYTDLFTFSSVSYSFVKLTKDIQKNRCNCPKELRVSLTTHPKYDSVSDVSHLSYCSQCLDNYKKIDSKTK